MENRSFVDQLNEIIYGIHKNLSGDREELMIVYEPDTEAENLENALRISREKDIKYKMTSVGPHRDDFCVKVNGIDIRRYGSWDFSDLVKKRKLRFNSHR